MSNPSEAVFCVLAVQEAEALKESGDIHFSVWKWFTMFDMKVCEACLNYYRDEYELEDPNDLLLMYPYGYFLDAFTFNPMIHPNDRCHIERVRDYDFQSNLIRRNEKVE